MLNLKQGLDHEIEIEGAVYDMDLSYDNVLRWYDLVKDEDLTELQKIVIAFKMFVPDCPNDTDMNAKVATVENIATYLTGKTEADDEQPQDDTYDVEEDNKQYFDFDEDSNYIYASFMQEYNIDLIDQRGKLAWEKFIALLNGMRSNTKFNEIVSIRATELPTGNSEAEVAERNRLLRLKEVYALKSSVSEREELMEDMFANIMSNAIIKKGGQSDG